MSEKRLTRRALLRGAMAGSVGLVLAACQAKTVEVTKIVEKEVTREVAKEVTKVIEKEVMITATPVDEAALRAAKVTPAPVVVRKAGLGLEGELEVYAGGFTPGIARGEGLNPLMEPQKVADAWRDMHPGAKIKWREGPGQTAGAGEEWYLAQIVGGTAPDVMPLGGGSEMHAQAEMKGWYINLDPALELPNPYIEAGQPGSVKWEDSFYPQAWMQRGSFTGHRHYLVYTLDCTGLYYNQTIFDKVGVEFSEVATFAEMLDAFDAVKEAGYIPTLMNMNRTSNQSWWLRIIRTIVNEDRLFNTIDLSKDQNITQPEWSYAIRKGIWDAKADYWWEAWRIMLLLEPYQQEGYMGPYDFTLFTGGDAATVFDGSWNLAKIADDPRRQFEYGLRNLPPVTRKLSPMGWKESEADPEKVRTCGGGWGDALAITKMAVDRGKGELALDFVQWYLAPQNLGPMVSERSSNAPNVKGCPPDPRMLPFTRMSKDTAEYADPWTKLVSRFRDAQLRLQQQLYSGEIDQIAFQSSVQEQLMSAANELCGKFGWPLCRE